MSKEVNKLATEIKKLSFEERSRLYTVSYGFGSIASIEMNDKLVLLSLIALTSTELKKKNENMTTLEMLEKITKIEKDEELLYNFIENLAILADDLAYHTKVFDSCGMKSSKEIINKIKETIETWLPF